MSHNNANRRKPAAAAKLATTAVLALVLACLGLVACGGSSKSSSTTTIAAATTAGAQGSTTGPTGRTGGGGGRFKALRECMQQNGITLPQRTPGTRRPPGPGGFLGGAGVPQLPKGVTRAQYEAAIKKCGGSVFGGAGRFKRPGYQQAIAKFAACMRENGVNVPQPNTSGSGPVFNTKGLNPSSAQFKAAEAKCRSDLEGAFPRRAGAGGTTGGPGGAT
jgi:hypothetical protein